MEGCKFVSSGHDFAWKSYLFDSLHFNRMCAEVRTLNENVNDPTQLDETTNSWNCFRSDLKWSFRCWAAGPGFVLFNMAVLVLLRLADEVSFILNFIAFLALVPVPQRVYYLRRFEGRAFSIKEMPNLIRRGSGRFFGLAFLIGIPVGVVIAILGYAEGAVHLSRHDSNPAFPFRMVISILVVTFLLDALLTFVTPALAFTTGSANQAFKIGLNMLRGTWPNSMWYVLSPGLTFSAIVLVVPASSSNLAIGILVSLVSGMLAFGFRGAVVPYYLRHIGTVADVDNG